jgi:glutathione S-transferase
MIDSEMSRLALDHYGIAYEEKDHLFGWVSLLTLMHGGYGRVPILYRHGVHLSGPREIIDYFDGRVAPQQRLIPRDEPARWSAEADWARYNGEMASDAAVVAYFWLLPERALMISAFAKRIPALEARLLPSCYGFLRGLFSLLLSLNTGHANDALERVRIRFETTDKRFSDGRAFLGGDVMTLADLSLISAAAPLLFPQGYGAPMPVYEELPSALKAIVQELRQHPTGKFVERFYAAKNKGSSLVA